MDKKKKRRNIICGIISAIILLGGILVFGGTRLTYDRVMEDNYRSYYIFKRAPIIQIDFMGGYIKDTYYFLPFQKLILTRKIEKDLSEEIMSLPEKYSNNIRNVQIREDFESVVIYYYKDTGPGEAYTDMEEKARFTIQLYHELKNVKSDGKIFNFTPVPR